jgi:hypothetical protein
MENAPARRCWYSIEEAGMWGIGSVAGRHRANAPCTIRSMSGFEENKRPRSCRYLFFGLDQFFEIQYWIQYY